MSSEHISSTGVEMLEQLPAGKVISITSLLKHFKEKKGLNPQQVIKSYTVFKDRGFVTFGFQPNKHTLQITSVSITKTGLEELQHQRAVVA